MVSRRAVGLVLAARLSLSVEDAMHYTDWTPEAVAALFQKHGITPKRGYTYERTWALYGCPVACLARDAGVLAEDATEVRFANLLKALDYPEGWLLGVMDSFDGNSPNPLLHSPEYDAGLALGTAVADLVFAAVAA